MPSKGIDFYGYVADGFTLEVNAWDAHADHPTTTHFGAGASWQQHHYELNTAWAGLYYEGRLQFIARKNGHQLFERSLRVNAMTGGINDEDLHNFLIPAVVADEFCLSFGLYNSDAAIVSDLPNAHQVYVSLTVNQSRWQQRLFEAYAHTHSVAPAAPLGQLLLPGSHDAGMYLPQLPQALENLANTQKDDIAHQLQLGARYFDFRPGYIQPDWEDSAKKIAEADISFGGLWQVLKTLGIGTVATALRPFVGQLRHVHAIMPGATYEEFMGQIGAFLRANTQEIVVVRIKYDGFLAGAVAQPTKPELVAVAQHALAGTGVGVGDKTALTTSLAELLRRNERLIVLYQEDGVRITGTYNDDDNSDRNYQSYDAQHILNALNGLNGDDLSQTDWVDAQVQLTATAVAGGIARAVMANSPATSPLRATKPRTDARSYDWLRTQLQPRRTDVLLTVCNDFYDNALTEVAYQVCKKRLGL